MIRRIFHADLSNIHHAAFWLAFFSAFSALLGLIRDRLLASNFGASRPLDIYYAAFRVPDFIYGVMLFFTAATAIIPVFLASYEKNKKEGEELFGSLLIFFLFSVVIISILAFFLMPFILDFLLPGFNGEEKSNAVLLSRILLLSPLFLGLSNILSGITESFRRFIASAMSPVLYNLGIIIGIYFFMPLTKSFYGIVWGVILGAVLHMSIQLPAISKIGVSPQFSKLWNSDLKKVLKFSFPRTMGLQVAQIAAIFLTGLASTLSQGSIAVFNFASNLQSLPVTIIGLSYSMAAFPNLALYSIKKARGDFQKHFSSAFRHILFWTLPASALILVLRAQIVRVILGSGAFNWVDTRLTAAALFILSLAVIFQSLFILLVWAFYAEGQSWKPLLVNIISNAIGVLLAFWLSGALSENETVKNLFSSILNLSDIYDIRVLALPVGILASNILNLVLLSFSFKLIFGYFPSFHAGRDIFQIILGSAVAGVSAYIGLNIFAKIFDLHTFLGIFLQGLFAGILGIIMWALVLRLLKNREVLEISANLKSVIFEEKLTVQKEDIVPIPEAEKLP
ncbi:hypothetical protein HYS99_00360 [Candidatus Giovannonibacteria bacterium]|nr:hypothetical protein [Candidatus Giovannonibacteria bacterium]